MVFQLSVSSAILAVCNEHWEIHLLLMFLNAHRQRERERGQNNLATRSILQRLTCSIQSICKIGCCKHKVYHVQQNRSLVNRCRPHPTPPHRPAQPKETTKLVRWTKARSAASARRIKQLESTLDQLQAESLSRNRNTEKGNERERESE